jgi:CRISPR-associated endonuclease/helicase Cas3
MSELFDDIESQRLNRSGDPGNRGAMQAFAIGFRELSGHEPFEWQTRFSLELIADRWPEQCDIPTGLGKTSVITIWLLALMWQVERGEDITVPRRLVYIVDRQVVVDQATLEAEKLQEKVLNPGSPFQTRLQQALASLCLTGSKSEPLVISTLRGQRKDNEKWYRDPSRVAIIVGTIDMLGSRLLFSGYGLGKYLTSLQAGLLGQDSFFVLDEAHLCPSFEVLLARVREQIHQHPLLRPFRLLFLTATGRNAQPGVNPFILNAEAELPEARKRLTAVKKLSFIAPTSASEKLANQKEALRENVAIQVAALAPLNESIVVYLNTVEHLLVVQEKLEARGFEPVVLTGEMRGKERNDFLKRGLLPGGFLAPFLGGHPQADAPSILLTTSCGEVGIDLDADHIVCDLVSLERMIQRFGRCNRFGNNRRSEIRVVLNLEPESPWTRPTLDALHSLPAIAGGFFDASPDAVSALLHNGMDLIPAFEAAPLTALLDDFLLDDFALTSVPRFELDPNTGEYEPDYLRPEVAFWLRGLAKENDNGVQFVWRSDLDYAVDGPDAMAMARVLPLQLPEIAKIPIFRVERFLRNLQRHQPDDPALTRIPVQRLDESWEVFNIEDLLGIVDELVGSTIYLASRVGGLNPDGLPEYRRAAPGTRDAVDDTLFKRYLFTRAGQQFSAQELNAVGQPVGPAQSFSNAGNWEGSFRARFKDVLNLRQLNENAGQRLSGNPASRVSVGYANLVDKQGRSKAEQLTQSLAKHLAKADRISPELVALLNLPANLRRSVNIASANHDLGKNRRWWQRYVLGNFDYPAKILAKIKDSSQSDIAKNEYYRHEFGSLLDVEKLLPRGPDTELILHLIAAHHGHARPDFAEKRYAKLWKELSASEAEVRQMADAVRRRYFRLQRTCGWWALAYLEALVKCTDIAASPEKGEDNE